MWNQSTTSQILTIHQIFKKAHVKNLEAALLSKYFSKAFDSRHKDRVNTASIWSCQRNCYRYNDTLQKQKAMIHSPDGDTNFFDIVDGVLLGDTLALYIFII